VSGTAAERYLELGLRLDRHVDGIVDSYFGPPELATRVKVAPPADPRRLVGEAESLLDDLDDGWLHDQVVGVRTFAGVLAGEAVPYADEVERCYGVRPTFTDEAVFAATHEELEGLLPGDGQLSERYERWRRSTEVPADRIESVVSDVVDVGRAWTSRRLDLPAGENVRVESVRNKPWVAYCRYLGEFRSAISVNLDLPYSAFETLQLTFHETYPGHHAERCLKDELLARERGLLEETIVLLPTAQSLIAEGIATLAPELVLESRGEEAVAAVDGELDLEGALAVERARRPLSWVAVNAALLLYERGESPEAVQEYIERWGLVAPDMAAHQIRFLQDPTSRSYVLTYAAGRELCRDYVAGDPARFRRLLTEQVRVGELLAGAA
jgi:hypothetical protein